jgi:hypothetical protein
LSIVISPSALVHVLVVQECENALLFTTWSKA